MNSYYIFLLMNYSIFVGALIGLVRFSKIDQAYFPFIYCTWLASLNELLSTILIFKGFSNSVTNNLYVLGEALLVLWQFRRWGIFFNKELLYKILFVSVCVIWCYENYTLKDQSSVQYYFRIAYSFLIVLMSIQLNNKLIITYRNSLWRSPTFIICSGFIIYYTYKILVEAFYLYGLNGQHSLALNIYYVHGLLNFIVNLLFAIAISWIPVKPRFISL